MVVFFGKHPLMLMIWGYPHFRKPPSGTVAILADQFHEDFSSNSEDWTNQNPGASTKQNTATNPLVNIQKANEHGHRNSWFTRQTLWFSMFMLAYQRVSDQTFYTCRNKNGGLSNRHQDWSNQICRNMVCQNIRHRIRNMGWIWTNAIFTGLTWDKDLRKQWLLPLETVSNREVLVMHD